MLASAARTPQGDLRPPVVGAFWSKPERLALSIRLAIGGKLAILFALAFYARFVTDELWQLSQSLYLFDGFFETITPGKALGYALFYELAHAIGWSSVSTALLARLQTALLACGTLYLTYRCARALGEDKLRAALIVLLLLSFSNFVERIFRTISEPLAVFFAVAALLMVLRDRADRPARLLLSGLFLGLAFVSTQKAIFFDVALGLALVADAAWERRYGHAIARGLWLVAGWALAVAAYCLVLGEGRPVPVFENLILVPADIATRGGADVYGGLRQYVWQTLSRNFLIYGFCFTGMFVSARRFGSLVSGERIALVFTAIVTLLIFTHSEPWPYVFIMAMPFLALWALRAYAALPVGFLRRNAPVWVALAIALSFAANLYYFRFGNRDQLDLMTRAEARLAPGDTYFDGIGMLVNRRQSPPLWLDRRHVLMTLEQGTQSPAYQSLTHTQPRLILQTYRTAQIREVIDPAIAGSYEKVSANILQRKGAAGPNSSDRGPTGPMQDNLQLFEGAYD